MSNLPNLITISRLVITAACFIVLERADPHAPDPVMVWWAFGLFVFAAGTDFLDGWIARRLNAVTMFGRVADPFADKVLVCGVLVILLKFPAALAVLTTWFVVVIIAREFLVTTIRGMVESQGHSFPAERLGKIKMVVQTITAGALLTLVAGEQRFHDVAVFGFWLTLILTVASGLQYVYRARVLLVSQ
ncbi:MAG: CDP-diacylglycerol--glycerol-3-phosphate 3-phosphatidyltransferase [Planctomycetota bacterium]